MHLPRSAAAFPFLLALAVAVAAPLAAQANAIPGRDIQLLDTSLLLSGVRSGTFPSGISAVGAWTTCCNPGSAAIPFIPAMNTEHAYIHFLVARESGGRFVQISDWSYVKHTFGSSNDNSPCGPCGGPGNFNLLEVGCSDTYANFQALEHYWLGPPSEIDPWLGTWTSACSFFDRGEPPAPPRQLCDGIRSLSLQQSQTLDQTINHQIQVHDDDLNVAGANWYWQAGYLCPAEPEQNRGNNIGSRQVTPSWNGTFWVFTDGAQFVQGSILQRWSGSSLSSATNGTDDGRFFVAVKVTGPVDGRWHYEYAVHNRDNKRGLGALRIPVCPTAQVTNFGFHDVDRDPLNDWVGAVSAGEISFTTAANPLRWNSLFNFWFDCDAAPITGSSLSLDQFDPGTGAPTVLVTSTAPGGLYNENLGPGCGSPTAPALFATGAPARAVLGNSTFQLRSTGNPPGAFCAFLLATLDGTTSLTTGCTLYAASLGDARSVQLSFADASGTATMALPVPASTAFEGTHLDLQVGNLQVGGAWLGAVNLSNGLRLRIGNLLTGCP